MMFRKLIPATDIFKSISTLVTGTFIAQLVPVLLQSVLRRMYPAEDFAVFAVFLSITGILMVVASLRYEIAIVLPEKKEDAINLTFGGIIISLLFSLVLLVLILIFKNQILLLLNVEPRYGFMLYYLPPAIFLFSAYQVMNYYLVRQKAYRAISVNKVSRRVSEGFGQVLLGFMGKLTTGLVVGNIAGHVANVIAGWFQMMRYGFVWRVFSLKAQWQLLKKYHEYPVYNMVPAFLNSLCMHLPLILVNKFYTAEITAQFDLSRQVLVLPASILTLSISQVLLQAISEKFRDKAPMKADLKRIIGLLALLAGVMTVVTMLWAPFLFALYAGADYYQSGIFARIIVLGAAVKLVVSPVSSVLAALNKIKLLSIWQGLYFVLIGLLVLFRDADVFTFLYAYLAIDLVSYGVLFILIWKATGKYEQSVNRI